MFGKKKGNENSGSQRAAVRAPKDVLESIPYRTVYPFSPTGMIEDYDGRFSCAYHLPDTNFDTASEDKQESMYGAYEKLINIADENMIAQVVMVNRTVDPDLVRNNLLMRPKQDGLNEYREEWNNVLLSGLSNGHNNVRKDKFFVVSTKARDAIEANDILKRVSNSVSKQMMRLTKQPVKPMSIDDRLALFYDIYNPHNGTSYTKTTRGLVDQNGKIDFHEYGKSMMQTKEIFAPSSMSFRYNSFTLGDTTFCRTFYISKLPHSMSTSFMNDITSLPCNMIFSVTFIPMNMAKAMAMIKAQKNGMDAQINKIESEAAEMGVSNSGAVSSELINARDEAEQMMLDVIQNDMHVFQVTPLVTLMCPSEDELKRQSNMLKQMVTGHNCSLRAMDHQQEIAFDTCLPLAAQHTEDDRVMTTEESCCYMPFDVQDLNQENGIYYGINPISGNMIIYNRKKGSNNNGIVAGASGSGKSFLVKQGIAQRFLNTNDKIIIIDPEGEYSKLAKSFGGTIIDISLTGKTHINPLDMDMQYGGQGENPIPAKCDSIEVLIETMMGGADSISPIEKTCIHRVGRQIYRGYYEHMLPLLKKGITCDKAAMPTLQDFYYTLLKQPDPQAQYMATAIEEYCIGNQSIFAERTNVDTDNRLIVYNVTEMSSGMKELAMHVCLNDAWNHMIANGIHGEYTDLYIDEGHLFTKTHTSAQFMQNIYRRARKWHGMPTFITQNISDLFVNDEALAMLDNTSFMIIMNQSPNDRAYLQKMYPQQLSDMLMEYITDQPYGIGILYTGTSMVPFENSFPTDTKMYEMMDSRRKESELTDKK